MAKNRVVLVFAVFLLGIAVGVGIASLRQPETPAESVSTAGEADKQFLASVAGNKAIVQMTALVQGSVERIDGNMVYVAEGGEDRVPLFVDENTEIAATASEGEQPSQVRVKKEDLQVGDRLSAQATWIGESFWATTIVVLR